MCENYMPIDKRARYIDMANKGLVASLKELAELTDILEDSFRSAAYRKAAAAIEKLTYKITKNTIPNATDRKISGIGAGIIGKITEYVDTGKIAEIDRLRSEPKIRAERELNKVAGAGPATVKHWISLGVRGLPDLIKALREKRVKLTAAQIIGLKYYDELNTRIPRAEVARVFADLRDYLPRRSELAGSYRRGAQSSGDVDIICEGPPRGIEDDPRCVAVISKGPQRITFIWCSKRCVQVDILITDSARYWAALNYLTGSKEHNEYLRGVAKKKGYRLNQRGLFKYVGTKLILVPTNSEQDIYRELGVEYAPPTAR